MFENNQFNNNGMNNNTNQMFSNNPNTPLNSGINQNEPMFSNQNANQGFVQPWQMQNNAFQQQAFNNGYTNFNSTTNFNQSQPVDVPPDLGEIKNLSEATVANAPTMDVLEPMNVMPDSLPKSSDLLDAYESGKLNVNYNSPTAFSNQTFPQQNEVIAQQNFNNNSNASNFNSLNNNFQAGAIEPQNNFTNEYQIPNANQNIFNNEYQTPNLSSLNQMNQTPLSSQAPFDNYAPNLSENYNNDTSSLLRPNNELSSSQLSKEEQEDKENKVELPENQELSDINSDEMQVQEELNKADLDSKQDDETNLSSLGLDESYAQPDMLEIMDLDNDSKSEETKEVNGEENKDSTTVLDNVTKIKNVIEDLKNKGADIEVEEFDFETMYQLVVKLNK